MAKVDFSIETIVNNPVTKKQLEGFVEELVLCKGKIRTERETIKDIMKEAKDSLGIPGKILGELVNEKMNPGAIDAKVHAIEEAEAAAVSLGLKE